MIVFLITNKLNYRFSTLPFDCPMYPEYFVRYFFAGVRAFSSTPDPMLLVSLTLCSVSSAFIPLSGLRFCQL